MGTELSAVGGHTVGCFLFKDRDVSLCPRRDTLINHVILMDREVKCSNVMHLLEKKKTFF